MILVIDTETTGMEPGVAEVIELAGVAVPGGESWSALIKPVGTIPPEASAVHHLTSEDFEYEDFECEGYRGLSHAWVDMLLDFNQTPGAYAAHNALFDRSMAQLSGCGVGAPWLCTWRCAMHLWPDAPAYGNQVLRYYLGLKPDIPIGLAPHRALYDAITTSEILKTMLTLKPLEELLKLQYQPVLLRTCRLPKYRGVLWKDVPKNYLKWILGADFDLDIAFTARYYLEK